MSDIIRQRTALNPRFGPSGRKTSVDEGEKTTLSQNSSMVSSPRTAVSSPRTPAFSPRTAAFSPRTTASSPRTAASSPRTAISSPRTDVFPLRPTASKDSAPGRNSDGATPRYMTEGEVTSLVHNALRRARQATESVSPRRRTMKNFNRPTTPREEKKFDPESATDLLASPSILSVGSSSKGGSASFEKSQTGRPNDDVLQPRMRSSPYVTKLPSPTKSTSSFTSQLQNDYKMQLQSMGSKSSFTSGVRSVNSKSASLANVTTDSSNDEDDLSISVASTDKDAIDALLAPSDADSDVQMSSEDDSYFAQTFSSVNSSDAIIRKVEEEIANARKAAQDANRRLADVSSSWEIRRLKSTSSSEVPKDDANEKVGGEIRSSESGGLELDVIHDLLSVSDGANDESYHSAMDVIGAEFGMRASKDETDGGSSAVSPKKESMPPAEDAPSKAPANDRLKIEVVYDDVPPSQSEGYHTTSSSFDMMTLPKLEDPSVSSHGNRVEPETATISEKGSAMEATMGSLPSLNTVPTAEEERNTTNNVGSIDSLRSVGTEDAPIEIDALDISDKKSAKLEVVLGNVSQESEEAGDRWIDAVGSDGKKSNTENQDAPVAVKDALKEFAMSWGLSTSRDQEEKIINVDSQGNDGKDASHPIVLDASKSEESNHGSQSGHAPATDFDHQVAALYDTPVGIDCNATIDATHPITKKADPGDRLAQAKSHEGEAEPHLESTDSADVDRLMTGSSAKSKSESILHVEDDNESAHALPDLPVASSADTKPQESPDDEVVAEPIVILDNESGEAEAIDGETEEEAQEVTRSDSGAPTPKSAVDGSSHSRPLTVHGSTSHDDPNQVSSLVIETQQEDNEIPEDEAIGVVHTSSNVSNQSAHDEANESLGQEEGSTPKVLDKAPSSEETPVTKDDTQALQSEESSQSGSPRKAFWWNKDEKAETKTTIGGTNVIQNQRDVIQQKTGSKSPKAPIPPPPPPKAPPLPQRSPRNSQMEAVNGDTYAAKKAALVEQRRAARAKTTNARAAVGDDSGTGEPQGSTSDAPKSKKVRFRQRYPVPPIIAKNRPPEEIIQDNELGDPEYCLHLAKPKRDLQELLNAVKDTSLARRANACGALKVLTTKPKNMLTLVRTAGFLDALVFAAEADIDPIERDVAIDARTRAVNSILNVCKPKDNRVIVFSHTRLPQCLVKCIIEDDNEARAAACGAIATLVKSPECREALAKVQRLIEVLSYILRGRKDLSELDGVKRSPSNEEAAQRTIQSAPSEDDHSSIGSSMDDNSYESEFIPDQLPHMNSIRQQKIDNSEEMFKLSRMNACAALLHMSRHCAISDRLSANRIFLDAVLAVTQEHDNPLHTKCLEILCNLTRFPSNNAPLAKYPHVVDTLVGSGKAKLEADRVWSLRALQNLSSDVVGKTILATAVVLELLSVSVMRKRNEEVYAATATLYNLSTEPGAVVPLTNTKNVVATLVHIAHAPETPSEVRLMACDALATLGLWLQTLAGAGTVPDDVHPVPLPSYATQGWERWE